MLAPIVHRGPDAEGIFIDDRTAFGQQRLIVIDPEGGDQPRVDPESGDVLIFNGEIYDYARHAAELGAAGVTLRDKSDTEVLFQLIRRHGVEGALARIDGMFAIVFRDGKTGRLSLARDRFGEKPLFYGLRNNQIVFASELKSILKHPAFRHVEFDDFAIQQYLAFDYVPGPLSGLRDIRKLMPGELLRFSDGEVTSQIYWRPRVAVSHSEARSQDETAAADRLDNLLRDNVRSRLVADVPVGIFLSGGIDSSLIAAIAADLRPEISTHSIRFAGDGYDESRHAGAVARHLRVNHVISDVSPDDVMSALSRIEATLDEPFADSSIVPTYLLCNKATEHITVALGGDGGDELFAGYINFQAQRLSSLLAMLPQSCGRLLRQFADLLPVSDRYMAFAFKLGQLANGVGHPAAEQPFRWMESFSASDRAGLCTKPVADEELLAVIAERLSYHGSVDRLHQLQLLFLALYLPDNILTKVDRASMLNSLEVRAPFLSEAMADFALSLPANLKLRGRQTKWILRRVAARYLPREIVSRPKHGFALPVAALLRGELKERVADRLLDSGNPAAGLFQRDYISRLLDEHIAARRDHRKRLWNLYMLFVFADNVASG